MQQFVRSSVSSDYVVKSNTNTISILKFSRSSVMGLPHFHGGGLEFSGKPYMPKHVVTMPQCRGFRHKVQNNPILDRDYLAQLWVLDKEMTKALERRKMAHHRYRTYQKERGGRHVFKQPPLSQSITGNLAPTSPEEVNFTIEVDVIYVVLYEVLFIDSKNMIFIIL